MPTIQTSSEETDIPGDLFTDILKGHFHGHLNSNDFNELLSGLLSEESHSKKKALIIIKQLEHLAKKESLKNVWNFCRDYISSQQHQIPETITEKLLKLQSNFISLYGYKNTNVNYTYTENDEKAINSYFSYLEEFFQIPDFRMVQTEYFSGEDVFGLSKGLLKSIIKNAPNITQYSKATNQTKIYNYDITAPLNSFVKGAGNLILKLRNNDKPYHFIEESVKDLTHAAKIKIQPTTLSSLRFNFLSQYHHGYSDIEEACQQLFNTTECYPYVEKVNQEFQLIIQGHPSTNATDGSKILEQLLFGSPKIILQRLKTFKITTDKNNPLSNLLDYLKNYVNEANVQLGNLPSSFVENSSRLIIHLKDMFTENSPRPKMLNKSLSLFLTILKNPSIANHHFHLWPALSACADEVKTLLRNYNDYSASHNTDINTSLRIFSAILHSINNINPLISQYNQEINTLVKELSEACLNLEICDSFSALSQFSKNLGTMARRLFKTGKLLDADATIKNVQDILKNATNQVTEDELKGIAWAFLNQYHDKDASQIARDCQKLFNLSDCHKFVGFNGTMEMEDDTTAPTTLIPEVITNNTTSTTTPTSVPQVNTTIAPAINQTGGHQETSTFSPISFPETPSTTEIITAIAQDLGSKLPSATEISSTAAHSFGSGLLNLMTQATSIWLRNKGYGKSVISGLSLSLASGILQASYMATFPVMLFTLNQLVAEGNEEEAQAQWDLMTQEMLPAFFTSLTLSTGLQLLNYLSENYLSKQSTLKGLIQSIPTLSSLWSFSRNPILTGIHTGIAYGTSVVGLFGFNQYWGARNRHADVEADNENNAREMVFLNTNEKKDSKSTDNGTVIAVSETPEKIYHYITEEKFNEIKNQVDEIIKALESLVSSLERSIGKDRAKIEFDTNPAVAETYQTIIDHKSYVLQIIKLEVKNCKQEISFLEDDHKKAYQKYIIESTHTSKEKKEIKTAYSAAMDKLGNVFKRMEPMFNVLNTNLVAAKEYIKGANKSFAGDDHTLVSLDEIINKIQFPLSSTKTYVSTYNTWSAAEQAEKNGAKNALANQEKFNNVTPKGTATLLRKHKTNGTVLNRACSMYSDRTHSSGSEADSAISTGSSRDEENAQIIRPLLRV